MIRKSGFGRGSLAGAVAIGWIVLAVGSDVDAAATFNVFADTDSAYIGQCVARYYGTHAAQVVNATSTDDGRPWELDAKLQGGPCPQWKLTASTCEKNGILPGTTFLSCETQHDHPCINTSGPYFWAVSLASFKDTFEPGKADFGDCHRIQCGGLEH